MNNETETLEQEATLNEIETPTPDIKDQPINLSDSSQNEFVDQIEWIEIPDYRNKSYNEEKLQIMVYYKTDKNSNKQNGRITFSHFLSKKFGSEKKLKFGALEGKILFQVTDTEGLPAKISSSKYSKLNVSNRGIVEIILEKYNLKESNQSTYFRLKDLGNDFYLIDEIIK